MDLQNTFYVLGIITMGLMLVLLIALVTAVFVIRAKVVAIHKMVDEKLNVMSNLASVGTNLFKSVTKKTDKSH